MKNRQKKKKGEFIDSSLELKNKNFKLFSEINEIKRKTNIKITYKILNNELTKEESKKSIIFTKRESIFDDLIIFLLISIIFKLSFQNSITYQDSIITLKVSGNGDQNVINDGRKPNEIWIDERQKSVAYRYNLNPTNIVKLKWTKDIISCDSMFEGCNSIVEINFTNFDATKCPSITSMFRSCHSLRSLDLSGFITSCILNCMSDMFYDCKSLISLNLSTFNTSEVTNFGHMLYNCESLEWVDVSNFKTEKVTCFDNMFNGCKNLTSVNLSNFYTSKMTNMQNMFYGCESLKIIDFPNLDITSVTDNNNLKNVFFNCKNLEYINIKNLKSNINLAHDFFNGALSNLIECIDSDKNELVEQIIEKNSCILISCIRNLHKYNLNRDGCFIKNCL